MTASVQLSPLPKQRFTDSNGNPLSGGKVFTYAAGTTTKQNSYTDSTGGTPNQNPVILDSRGEAPIWLDQTLAYKVTVSPANDSDPPTSPYWTIDNIPISPIAQLQNSGNGFGADLVGGSGRVVANVAALKALVKTGVGKAQVLGYYAAGDGGGGQYYYDPTDTTSADNGGSIFVAADGGRWKLSTQALYAPRQFGVKADGVTDDNTAWQAFVTFINAIPNTDRYPVAVFLTQGFYKYSGTLWFTRPVAIFSNQAATLNYTGTSYAIKLGPDGLSGSNIQLNAEYTVDGLRFENCTTAAHVIYINEFITEPRIRNCTFVDCGNGTSYCILGQYGNWDAIVENCRLLVLNGSGGENFIAFNGLARTPSGSPPYAIDPTNRTGYDGGNSRVTIRDCFMTALGGQQLGVFAYLNGVKCRIVGGGFQWSNYGIYLSGFASAVTIDSVYAELSSSGSQCMVYAESTNTTGNVRFQPENVTMRNCYCNMHGSIGVASPVIKTADTSMLFKGWRVEDLTITDIVTAQPLIVQNDTAGQVGNSISVRVPTDDTASVGKQYKIRGTYSNAENWATPGGVNQDVVGNVAYTFKQSDIGRYKIKTGVTAVSWTLPNTTDAQIEPGSVFYAFHGGTTANLSLIADSGVTIILTGTATTGTRTVAPNGIAKCELLAPNVYWVSGPGVS